MNQVVKLTIATLLFSLLCIGAYAGLSATDEAGGSVQSRRGDPSPSASDSNINEYTFQDEQINLTEESGVVKVLRVSEKNLINDFVTKVFPVKNASVREMLPVFQQICGKEGGRAESIRDSVKKEYYIQVICPKFQLPYIEEAIKKLDVPWLNHWRNGSVAIVYKAKFRDVADVDRIASGWGGGTATSVVDDMSNSVDRLDEPYRIQAYLKGAKLVDIPPNQVLIDVKFYEVDKINDQKIGLDYIAWKNGPGRNLFEFVVSESYISEKWKNASSPFNPLHPRLGGSDRTSVNLGQNYTSLNYLVTTAFLDFLQVKGESRILSESSILVKSGATGTVSTLDEVFAFEATPVDPGSDGTSPEQIGNANIFDRELHFVNQGSVGISLDVTPFIGLESMELRITAEVSTVSSYTPQGQPIINTQTIVSTVRLRDGEPFVLGGLDRTEQIEQSAKVPFLGSLPVLGWLFGQETETNRQTQVFVVLTPQFILGTESVVEIPEAFETAIAQVEGDAALAPPANPFGYDQWLLDANK